MDIKKSDVLNLGCGDDSNPNYWNVDVVDLEGVDEVVDLDEYPWPWDSSSWQRVIAKHVLEHLSDPIAALEEIGRVLSPTGELELWYPIGHTRFEDPTHRHFWNYHTAATIVGDRAHSHEHVDGFQLVDRQLTWSVDSRHWRWYTRARLAASGPGAWLSQIPGLSGTVRARYSNT